MPASWEEAFFKNKREKPFWVKSVHDETSERFSEFLRIHRNHLHEFLDSSFT